MSTTTGRPHSSAPGEIRLLSSLNPDQRDAVETTKGPLLVLAGAGTGKTRVITTRIAYLMRLGADPSEILAVTFTNKAAAEMKERVAQLAGDKAKKVTVGTFHSFCVRLLREHGKVLGLSPRFTITDASDQLSAVKSVMRELRVHETTMQPAAVLSRISLAKNRMETPEAFLDAGTDGRDQLVGSVWQRYQEHLTRNRSLDFDDLLLEAVRLLKGAQEGSGPLPEALPATCWWTSTRTPTTPSTRSSGRSAAGTATSAWWATTTSRSTAGAGPTSARSSASHKDFKGAKVVRLETNYRSTVPILEAANAVIRHNASRHEKALESAKGEGDAIRVEQLKDETAEAQLRGQGDARSS